LYDVERLERIAGLETRLINRDLFRKVIMRSHGRWERCSFLAGLVRFRGAGRELFARRHIHGWIIDSENFPSVRVDNGDEVAGVGVEIVVGA
jgi:hypothetical protein